MAEWYLDRYARRLRNRLSAEIGYRLIGVTPDDRFIAAYPRSGSTWLRTMLTNVLVKDAEGRPEVFNATIPAVSIRNASTIRSLTRPRLIMTHGRFRPSMRKVVYLVRDGRDVLVSYYHYVSTRRGRNMTFEEFYERYEQGEFGVSWTQHTVGWLSVPSQNAQSSILFLRFESMKADTEMELMRVCKFLGISCSKEDAQAAISMATLRHARKLEAEEHGRELAKNESFYRGGQTGGWRQFVNSNLAERIKSDYEAGLQLAGYMKSSDYED